jgi:broad specificity phosphatase PhoE
MSGGSRRARADDPRPPDDVPPGRGGDPRPGVGGRALDDPARAPLGRGPTGRRRRARARLAIPDRLDATLVLVRHGESELIVQRRFQGRLETPLSARGRRQAELVAHRLAAPHDSPVLPIPLGAPVSIVHSPLSRAAETAGAIGRAIRAADDPPPPIPIRPDDRFAEIGQATGRAGSRARSPRATAGGCGLTPASERRGRPVASAWPTSDRVTDGLEDVSSRRLPPPSGADGSPAGGATRAPATHSGRSSATTWRSRSPCSPCSIWRSERFSGR